MKRPHTSALIAAALLALLAQGGGLAQTAGPKFAASFGIPQTISDGKMGGLPSTDPPLEMPAKPATRIPMTVFWDQGIRFETADDQFRIHFGGTAQIDSTWLIGPHSIFALPDGGANGVGNSSATFLRRARLRADGELFGLFDFVIEYDFANASNENSGDQPPSFSNLTSSPSPASVWLQIRDVPLAGNIRIGYQAKPIGMINNTAQANLPFLERPDNSDAFYAPFDNGYTLGVTARSAIESERLAWTIGAFRPATNVFAVTLNKYAYGARVTGTPWYEDDGERLVHLGFGCYGGDFPNNELRVRARPELRNGPGFAVPVLVDTAQVPGSVQHTIGPEFAVVSGPFTLQAEWAGQWLTDASVQNQPQGTLFFHGGYLEALWFLTGEHASYSKRDGVFGRVVPLRDFRLKGGGAGAWQIGARFSYVHLNDKAVQGGEIYDWTLGVNWFLNPSVRFQANYIVEHREGPTGTPVGWFNGIGLRAAFDF